MQVRLAEEKIAVTPMPMYFYFQNTASITKSAWSPKRLDKVEALKAQTFYFKENGYSSAYRMMAGELAGFIAVGPAGQVKNKKSSAVYRDESYTDFALGLRPDLCGLGKGYGDSLLNACMGFLKAEFPEDGLRLTVSSDNLRAKRVYEKNGFKTVFEFKKFTDTPEGRKLIKYEIMQL